MPPLRMGAYHGMNPLAGNPVAVVSVERQFLDDHIWYAWPITGGFELRLNLYPEEPLTSARRYSLFE